VSVRARVEWEEVPRSELGVYYFRKRKRLFFAVAISPEKMARHKQLLTRLGFQAAGR